MTRLFLGSLALTLLLAGCAQKNAGMDMSSPPPKPAAAPEMKALHDFVGTWEGTAEFDPPQPGTTPMKSVSTIEYIFDGHVLRSEGWHEWGGQQGKYREVWFWNGKEYGNYYISDSGEYGAGTTRVDKNGVYHFKWKGGNAQGGKMSGEGTMRFIDNDTQEYNMTMAMDGQKMKMKGTAKRKK